MVTSVLLVHLALPCSTKSIEHHFSYLFAIHISSLMKRLFKSFAHLSHWVALYSSSISMCLGMGLICQRILLNVCSTLSFKICTCWIENLSPSSRPSPRGRPCYLLLSVFMPCWGRGILCSGSASVLGRSWVSVALPFPQWQV